MRLRRDLRYNGAEASEQAVCFHAVIYAARSTSRYGAWVGFFSAASEVSGTLSFEGYDRFPKPDHGFESAILGLDMA
jgi:hypothetical protein